MIAWPLMKEKLMIKPAMDCKAISPVSGNPRSSVRTLHDDLCTLQVTRLVFFDRILSGLCESLINYICTVYCCVTTVSVAVGICEEYVLHADTFELSHTVTVQMNLAQSVFHSSRRMTAARFLYGQIYFLLTSLTRPDFIHYHLYSHDIFMKNSARCCPKMQVLFFLIINL